MDLDDYNAALSRLGLRGPMGEAKNPDGSFVVFYRSIADGTRKDLVPGSTQTPDQRKETIKMLEAHFAEIERRRNHNPTKN